MAVKRNVWYAGHTLFQASGFLLPQARHYSVSSIFALNGLLSVLYLGNTDTWSALGLFLATDWISFCVRFWAASDHASNHSVWLGPFDISGGLRRFRKGLGLFRMQPVGRQSLKVLRGWYVVAEGFWATSAYMVCLMLYPISMYMDEKIKAELQHERNSVSVADEEGSILSWMFFRSPWSLVFILVAAANDLLQDLFVKYYIPKMTGCHYTRHLGSNNWKGNFYFLAAGWGTSFATFALVVSAKIARHVERTRSNGEF